MLKDGGSPITNPVIKVADGFKMKDKPNCGFKVKLNHQYPERWTQYLKVRWHQLGQLIMLSLRYIVYWVYIKIQGRTPLMDYLNVRTGLQMYGVPIGGIGSGTIGRGFKGEFCRYQLRPGIYRYETMYGNQFIVTIQDSSGNCVYQKVLSATTPPKNLKSWDWTYPGEDAEYLGLYPRSWTTYQIPEHKIELTCRQISPVIPQNYEDSCLPCAVFVWDINNYGGGDKVVSITFTFQNGIGEKSDRAPGARTERFDTPPTTSETGVKGVLIQHKVGDMPYTFAIGAKSDVDAEISRLDRWDPSGSGIEVWQTLKNYGCFPEGSKSVNSVTKNGQLVGAAVCLKTKFEHRQRKSLEFALAWDMPRVRFDEGVRHHYKYYTRQFGRNGEAGPAIVRRALTSYPAWEEAIEQWQSPILLNEQIPNWYKSALFNETYFVSDGGTVWLDIDDEDDRKYPPGDPRRTYGRFAYLEGHEYRMYNTYDVHFYASFALIMNWPKLQTVLQRDFADTIPQENTSRQWHLFDGDITVRKKKDSVPHDLGDPGEEPFLKINSYPIHDVSEWRDLDLKYVLQCYRDYGFTRDGEELRVHWPNMKTLIRGALRWDKDGDGLIENHGCPDQTYDTWTMNGASAYCGSLWLGALAVCTRTAELLEDPAQSEFSDMLDRAKKAFEKKLWNGVYYNFDCSPNERAKVIMSDQLCGLWYILCSGIPNEIVPHDHALSALKTIYDLNVKKFKNGSSGAVNGMTPDGMVDTYTIQSEEIWPGVVYSVSSMLIFFGLVDEAFDTSEGIYRTVYEQIGLGFETPEALYEQGCYRSIGYMRPLSIWSIQCALEAKKRLKNSKK